MTYKYANPDHTLAETILDGRQSFMRPEKVPAGAEIVPYTPVPPTADNVRAEAARRMVQVLGARDIKHMEIILSNGLRETARLQQILIDGGELTSEQQTRKALLEGADAAIETIRTKSNTLEAMDPVPVDYADNKWWV